jgi:hypothetical protein
LESCSEFGAAPKTKTSRLMAIRERYELSVSASNNGVRKAM